MTLEHHALVQVNEIVEKAPQLPSDIRWRFIGHLQSNKVDHAVLNLITFRLLTRGHG